MRVGSESSIRNWSTECYISAAICRITCIYFIKIVDYWRKTGSVIRTRVVNYGGVSAGKSTTCLLCTGGVAQSRIHLMWRLHCNKCS